MKNLCLAFSAALLLATTSASAQFKSSAWLKGGLNLSNITITKDGTVDKASSLPTFQVGLMWDIPFIEFFAFQPGIFFTGKGARTQYGSTSDNTYYRARFNPYYVEMPFHFVAKLPLNSSKFFLGAGPYIAIGVAGKYKTEGKLLGVAFSQADNIKFSNDDPTTSGEEGSGFGVIKRFDYGLDGTAGLQGSRIMASVNYGYGLAKIPSGTNSQGNQDNKYRVLSLTLALKL